MLVVTQAACDFPTSVRTIPICWPLRCRGKHLQRESNQQRSGASVSPASFANMARGAYATVASAKVAPGRRPKLKASSGWRNNC